MSLTITHLHKSFANTPVLHGIKLQVAAGEIMALLGPSGCGKTTLLRLIAGLEQPDQGQILFAGIDMATIAIHKRQFGFVFQDYALFPHKDVWANVAFGLRMQQWSAAKIAARVQEVLSLVGLAGFSKRPIHELSGGEQQRVALARALAPGPRLVLLDEPLGALDRALRERLMLELRAILKKAGKLVPAAEGITAVYVTHDQAEAFAIADRIAVMNQGRIAQMDTPQQLYQRPQTPFVARFLGMENIVQGKVMPSRMIRTGWGNLLLPESEQLLAGQPVTLLIRPEAVAQLAVGTAAGANVINGRLTQRSFRGRYQQITISPIQNQMQPKMLQFDIEQGQTVPADGEIVALQLNSGAIVLLERG